MTVWQIQTAIETPEDLGRHDHIHVEYESAGEDGLTEFTAIERLAVAIPKGTDGGS